MNGSFGGLEVVGFVGWWHLLLFGALVPMAAWRNRDRLATISLPPKKRYFASIIAQQLLLTAISVAVARSLGIPLFEPYRPSLGALVATALLLAVAVIGLRPSWRRQAAAGDRRVQLIAPMDALDHGLWAAISVLAGVGEELTYRGVMYWIVLQLTGSMAGAAAIAGLVFGVSHVGQGWKAVVVVTGFALAFQGLVNATGSLYPAMVVHVLYDLTAGISYGRYVRALARSNAFMNSTSATTLDRGQAL